MEWLLGLLLAALPLDIATGTPRLPVGEPDVVDGCAALPPKLRAALDGLYKPSKYVHTATALGCVEGRFPEAAWYVVVLVHDWAPGGSYDGTFALERVLVDGEARVVARHTEKADFTWLREDSSLGALEAVDFDGDGADEILETRDWKRRCQGRSLIHVVRRRAATLEDIQTVVESCQWATSCLENSPPRVDFNAQVVVEQSGEGQGRLLAVTGKLEYHRISRARAMKECGPGSLLVGEHRVRVR